jgi:hypothetical protein
VSTMLYLLSLQDVTYSPFRVVDEINQGARALTRPAALAEPHAFVLPGMDPHNERCVCGSRGWPARGCCSDSSAAG